MDIEALNWLFRLTETTGKLPSWRLRLLELDFDVVHPAALKRYAADTLLCFLTNGEYSKTLKAVLPVIAILDNREAQKGSLKDGSDEEDSDSRWEVTNRHALTYLQSSR